jgi:hypothetical protein
VLKPKKRKLSEEELAVLMGPTERAVRDSTKAKTVDADKSEKQRALLQAQAAAIAKKQLPTSPRTNFKQRDLLLEGLDTEVICFLVVSVLLAVYLMFNVNFDFVCMYVFAYLSLSPLCACAWKCRS